MNNISFTLEDLLTWMRNHRDQVVGQNSTSASGAGYSCGCLLVRYGEYLTGKNVSVSCAGGRIGPRMSDRTFQAEGMEYGRVSHFIRQAFLPKVLRGEVRIGEILDSIQTDEF